MIAWTSSARKDLRALQPSFRQRVLDAVERLPAGDVKKLQDRPGYRLRVGDWRVIFDRPGAGSILVKRILHRSAAY